MNTWVLVIILSLGISAQAMMRAEDEKHTALLCNADSEHVDSGYSVHLLDYKGVYVIKLYKLTTWGNEFLESEVVRVSPTFDHHGVCSLRVELEAETFRLNVKNISEPAPEKESPYLYNRLMDKLFRSFGRTTATYDGVISGRIGSHLVDSRFAKISCKPKKEFVQKVCGDTGASAQQAQASKDPYTGEAE